MKRSLKELAKEVGVTPSYLCRVFKKTMGITVGMYMTEFEREASKGETSVQSSNKPSSNVMDVETGFPTSAIRARSTQIPVEGAKRKLAEEDMGDVEEILDFNFNLDEWFLTEDYLNDSTYYGLPKVVYSPSS